MGVGDGRAFLRSLLARAFAGDESNPEQETTPEAVQNDEWLEAPESECDDDGCDDGSS